MEILFKKGGRRTLTKAWFFIALVTTISFAVAECQRRDAFAGPAFDFPFGALLFDNDFDRSSVSALRVTSRKAREACYRGECGKRSVPCHFTDNANTWKKMNYQMNFSIQTATHNSKTDI